MDVRITWGYSCSKILSILALLTAINNLQKNQMRPIDLVSRETPNVIPISSNSLNLNFVSEFPVLKLSIEPARSS